MKRKIKLNSSKKLLFREVSIKNLSGYCPHIKNNIPFVKKKHYCIIKKVSIGGDAPKEFAKIYRYGYCRKDRINTWPKYIVKTGSKYYPSESITEYLLNRIGQVMGMDMSESCLLYIGKQIRFGSKYFLKKNQELIHGADIYAGYLGGDREFVDMIENTNRTREFLSVKFTYEAIFHLFPENIDVLFPEFVKMLLFDAWLGVADRHSYNWGIVRNITCKKNKYYFSPLFDTSRGLFWNDTEDKINKNSINDKTLHPFIDNYIKKSQPKISWDENEINNIELFQKIYENDYGFNKQQIRSFFTPTKFESVLKLLDNEFTNLFTEKRFSIIRLCLLKRSDEILKIMS